MPRPSDLVTKFEIGKCDELEKQRALVKAKFKKQIGDYYRMVTKCKEIDKQLELHSAENGLFKNIGRCLTAAVDELTGISCRIPETPIDGFIDDYGVSTLEVSIIYYLIQ